MQKEAERVQSLLSSLELVLQAWDRQISSSRKGLEAVKGALSEASAPDEAEAAEAALSHALAASKAIEVHLAAVRGERLPSAVSGTGCESASQVASDRLVHAVPANVSEEPESCAEHLPHCICLGPSAALRRYEASQRRCARCARASVS